MAGAFSGVGVCRLYVREAGLAQPEGNQEIPTLRAGPRRLWLGQSRVMVWTPRRRVCICRRRSSLGQSWHLGGRVGPQEAGQGGRRRGQGLLGRRSGPLGGGASLAGGGASVVRGWLAPAGRWAGPGGGRPRVTMASGTQRRRCVRRRPSSEGRGGGAEMLNQMHRGFKR